MKKIVKDDFDNTNGGDLAVIENSLSSVDDCGVDLIKYDQDNNLEKLNDVKSNNEILNQYIQQISKFPVLSKESEEELFNLYIDKGNQKAGQAIILSHLRLVVKIAMQYKNFGINIMDMIAEGNVGLMIALRKFDRDKKARFSTYAGLWIKAKIQEFVLKSWNMIKVGSSSLRKQLLFNFTGLKKMLHIDGQDLNREQSKKIAKHFGISESEYDDVISSIKHREASLDAPVGGDGNLCLMDTIDGAEGNFANMLANREENSYKNKIFQESLSILDDRQKDILITRYLQEPKATLEDLSRKYNVSKERIRQIEESAIKKLKQFAESYKNS